MENHDQNPQVEKVYYVVVVHGMGEPRKGETVLPVINRFAEARYADLFPTKSDSVPRESPVSLGMVLGELSDEHPWMEFEHIPSKSKMDRNRTFTGRRSGSGENIRFVDMFWGNITNDDFKTVGEQVDAWTKSLLIRNEKQLAEMEKAQSLVHTELHFLLRNIRKTLIPVQKILSSRVKYMSDLIFNRFLGDVQLYAEYKVCRDKSVQLFHDTMFEVHEAHERENQARIAEGKPPRTPVYTVLAHSLGTVMSLDALVQARRNDATWIDHVENYVTLGSPIDKFLMLWSENYHFAETNDSFWDGYFWKKQPPINHFNYADEQDPVGHRLDLMHSKTALQRIFGNQPKEDKIFVRYPIPGKAHVDYWKDTDLFRRILHVTVDEKPVENAHPVQWYTKDRYKRVLQTSYIWTAFVFWAVIASLCIMFSVGQTFQFSSIKGVIFHPKEMVLRALYVVATLGIIWILEVPKTLSEAFRLWRGKNAPDLPIEKPSMGYNFSPSVVLIALILAIPVFTLYMSVGFGGMVMLGLIAGTAWLYFRVMELVMQWRQITVTMSDTIGQEMEERKKIRQQMKRQMKWVGVGISALCIGISLVWMAHHLNLDLIGWNLRADRIEEQLNALLTTLLPNRKSQEINLWSTIFMSITINALFLASFVGFFVYGFRIGKYIQVREEIKTLRNRAMQIIMNSSEFAAFKENKPTMSNIEEIGIRTAIHQAYEWNKSREKAE